MAKVNRGKGFEKEIREAFEREENISVDRLKDTQARFKDNDNVADFIIYKYPYELYIECKSRRGNTLNFKNDIRPNQWEGLQMKSTIKGVRAGVLVWFIDHDLTAYIDIEELLKLRAKGYKSVNVKDLQKGKIEFVEIDGLKKQIYYKYDIKSLLEYIQKR